MNVPNLFNFTPNFTKTLSANPTTLQKDHVSVFCILVGLIDSKLAVSNSIIRVSYQDRFNEMSVCVLFPTVKIISKIQLLWNKLSDSPNWINLNLVGKSSNSRKRSFSVNLNFSEIRSRGTFLLEKAKSKLLKVEFL